MRSGSGRRPSPPPQRDGRQRPFITRRRDPDNRRVHLVEMTQAGEEAFYRMRRAAFAFNERLQAGFGEGELAEFGRYLTGCAGTPRTGTGPRPGNQSLASKAVASGYIRAGSSGLRRPGGPARRRNRRGALPTVDEEQTA